MKKGDRALTPQVPYKDTKANIEALTNLEEGMEAYATDTNQKGVYTGAAWDWGGGVESVTDGWIEDANTWTYSSVDDPIGVLTIDADVTALIQFNDKIVFTNGGNTIYGRVAAVPTYSAPDTTIIFLHEIDPSDSQALHLMANSAITNPKYSHVDNPFGFPRDEDKWTVKVTDSSSRSQATPGATTWYNIQGINLSKPIGAWYLGYKLIGRANRATAGGCQIKPTISTANNSESDSAFTSAYYVDNTTAIQKTIDKEVFIVSTVKTTHYLNESAGLSGLSEMILRGDVSPTTLYARWAFL